MTVISRFLGIMIYMDWNEQNPPQIRAQYEKYEVNISIVEGEVDGIFPKHHLKLILEWLELFREELLLNWSRAGRGEDLLPLQSL